jgi:uncharacterized membrane protein YecN with MAPEG domain
MVKKKVKKQRIKKPLPVLKSIANTFIYGTPIATLIGMGIRVYVEETPTLSFFDNFTFQASFWAVVSGIVLVPLYLKLVRKKLRDKMLIQESQDGYVAPKYRLLQTANYTASMVLLIAFVYILRLLTSNEMLTFLCISGASGLVGYTMLTIDSANIQAKKELDKIQNG